MTVVPHTEQRHIARIDHGPRLSTKFIVAHGMEGTLEGSLGWWAKSGHEPDGAQLGFDDHHAVQTMDLDHKAWHAGAANGESIGFEHAGFAAWTHDHWLEHENMLEMSANRAGWVHHHYGLGEPHFMKTVFPHYYGGAAWGGHPCPGKNFPLVHYVKLAQKAYHSGWGL